MVQVLTGSQIKSLQDEHTIILAVLGHNYWALEYSGHRDRIDEICATLKENAVYESFNAA